MARLRAEIKSGFLRSLWGTASAAQKPLAQCLDEFQSYAFQFLKGGRIIQSTSGGGYADSYAQMASAMELTPVEVFALSEEFFAIYTESQSALTASGQDATDDNLCFATMMASDYMVGVRAFQGDFTNLRWPAVTTGQA